MKISKELALALDLESAPAEIKTAVLKLRDAIKKSHKAEKNFEAWRDEYLKSKADVEWSYDAMTKVIATWEPSFTKEDHTMPVTAPATKAK